MSFSEQLLEATGFENSYLVNTLGGMRGASIVGRLHAIGRKRTGPIDYILRNIPDILEDTIDDIGDTAMSIVDWSTIAGVKETKSKHTTFMLTFRSDLLPILGDELEGRDLAWVTLDNIKPLVAVEPKDFFDGNENDVEMYEGREDELSRHPVYALVQTLRDNLMSRVSHFQWIGMDHRTEPTTWYFRWISPADEVGHMSICCDIDAIEEEIRRVTNGA